MGNYRNFSFSQVVSTGSNQVTIISGDGAEKFADLPHKATIYPSGFVPSDDNAEIVNITGRTNDILFFERTQEGTTQRNIQINDIVARTLTAGIVSGIENKNTFSQLNTSGFIDSGNASFRSGINVTGNSIFYNNVTITGRTIISGALQFGTTRISNINSIERFSIYGDESGILGGNEVNDNIVYFSGVSINSFPLFWNYTSLGNSRRFSIYSDRAKTQLVSSGNTSIVASSTDKIVLLQQNGSNISGMVNLTASINSDTDGEEDPNENIFNGVYSIRESDINVIYNPYNVTGGLYSELKVLLPSGTIPREIFFYNNDDTSTNVTQRLLLQVGNTIDGVLITGLSIQTRGFNLVSDGAGNWLLASKNY